MTARPRAIAFPGWPHPVSALGFGCASLGSRVSARDGTKAIERALKAGVTWFDVAPAYGDGQAERILGEVLRGVDVAVATKVGLAPPPQNAAKLAFRAVLRPLVAAAPGLRAMVGKARAGGNTKVPLSPNLIRDSLARSLERLKKPRVAMLALHEPDAGDVARPELAEALAGVRREGLAAQIGLAGASGVFVEAMRNGFPDCVAQIAASPFDPPAEQVSVAQRPPLALITHSVLGVAGAMQRLTAHMADPELAALARARALPDGAVGARNLLLDYAFAANPGGVVLLSSFDPRHLTDNVRAAAATPDVAFARDFAATFKRAA